MRAGKGRLAVGKASGGKRLKTKGLEFFDHTGLNISGLAFPPINDAESLTGTYSGVYRKVATERGTKRRKVLLFVIDVENAIRLLRQRE